MLKDITVICNNFNGYVQGDQASSFEHKNIQTGSYGYMHESRGVFFVREDGVSYEYPIRNIRRIVIRDVEEDV